MENKIIYIGVDVHTTNFNITFYDLESDKYMYDSRLKPQNCLLVDYINKIKKKHYSDGEYEYEFIIGYEAGYTGYITCRYLLEHGLNCVVLAPSTIKRSQKQKKYKSDVADARLIAKTLANKDYSAVFIPMPEDESVKRLLSVRDLKSKELTQHKNKIKAFIQQKGYKYDKRVSSNWTAEYMKFLSECLEAEELPEDKLVLKILLDEYLHLQQLIKEIDARIEELAQKDRYRESVRNLCAFKGINTLIAMSIVLTVGDIRRFENPKQFANYLGLTPGMHSSAEKNNTLGITKNGNKKLRRLFVLAAQSYSRGNAYYKSKALEKRQEGLDPKVIAYAERARVRLQKKYIRLRNGRFKAHNTIVCAIARELANFVWGMLSGDID